MDPETSYPRTRAAKSQVSRPPDYTDLLGRRKGWDRRVRT
jgi:hypothetical protein